MTWYVANRLEGCRGCTGLVGLVGPLGPGGGFGGLVVFLLAFRLEDSSLSVHLLVARLADYVKWPLTLRSKAMRLVSNFPATF